MKKTGKEVSYCCGTYVRCGRKYCTPHRVSHKMLENILLDDLRKIIDSIDDLEKLTDKWKQKQIAAGKGEEADFDERAKIQTEIDKIRRLKRAVYEDYHEGLISRDEFTSYRQEYIKKEELLEKQLTYLKEKDKNEKGRNSTVTPWVKHLLTTGKVEELDRDTVTEMLYEIKVFEDRKIKIIYNFAQIE